MKLQKLLNIITVSVLALSFNLFLSNPAQAGADETFSGIGRCLQSQGQNKVLDIFFLIDESQSLEATDSEAKRADILSSSLIQLGSFRKDVEVNYSVGFFGDKYSVWRSWTTVSPGSVVSEAAKLEKEVRSRHLGKATNWLLGINGATSELNAQHERTKGCSTLIWLTDGGINLLSTKATADAVNTLCDSSFNNLRSSGVNVLGILLRDDAYMQKLSVKDREDQSWFMSLMKPLVEGKGQLSDGTDRTCGTYPVPKNYSEGAVFVANNANALAYEFMKLPPQIEGCKLASSTADGKLNFNAEAGISEFQVVTMSQNWQLNNPKKQSFINTSKDIEVYESTGVSQIRVALDETKLGKWNFSGTSNKGSLFVCSGLDIVIDEGVELIAGKPGKLSGRVILQSSKLPADLSVYNKNHPITVEQIGGDGSYTQPVQASQSGKSDFQIENFVPTPGQSSLEIRVTLYPKTKSGFALKPISVSKKLAVRLPSNYPSLKNSPVVLTDLKPSKNPSKGYLIFNGPVGANGKVCVDKSSKLKIVSDAVDRSDEYTVGTTGLSVDGCLPLQSGQSGKIQISVDNPVTAEANVKALLPVTYYSDAEPDKKFTLDAKVQFKTLIKGNRGPWEIALTILGVVLPLLLIQLMNYLTTKIAFGRQVQRASYDVLINNNDRYTDSSGASIQPAALDFKPRPEQPDVRSFEDGVGTFSTRLSKLVFPAPWYEVKAPDGSRVITLVHAAPQLKARFKSGKLAPIPGDMGKIWVLKISDEALRNFDKSSPIRGSLVIFKRNNNSKPNQFSDVFNSVTTKAGLWNEISRLAEVVKTETEVAADKPQRFKRSKPGDEGGALPPSPRSNPPTRPGSGRPGTGAQPTGSAPIRPGSTTPGSTSIRPGSNSPNPGSTAPQPGTATPRPGSGAPRPGSGNPRPGSSNPPTRN